MTRGRTFVFLMALFVASGAFAAIDFSAYHTPEQVDAELAALATANPAIAQRVSIGNSVEGRPIWALKISDNVASDEPDEGDVIIVALHHAREWVAAEAGLFMAEYLVEHFSDPELSDCLANLEVWVVPVANPDGYLHTTTDYRYWRKNRRDNGDGTFGVDLNRNYAFQWGEGVGLDPEGSAYSVDDTYWGSAAFSEPETMALRDFIQGLDHPRALLSFHTYGEIFLRPWSYTSADPPGESTLALLAQNSIDRISAVHGHTYQETIWYRAFGEMTDYFWHERRLAGFTAELRPTGTLDLAGFSPPASQILPAAEENLPAVLSLLKDAGCRRLWIKDHAADSGSEPSSVWLGDHWSEPFWTSPDIWTEPEALVEGETVTLHVRVHNDGPMASGASVQAFFTDPRIALEFPSLTSTLIGQVTVDLPPGDTVVDFSWEVPTGTNSWGEYHWCVGALVSHPEDRPLTTLIEKTSNLGGRNFQTVQALASQFLAVAATNFLGVDAEFRVTIDPATLPAGWEVVVPPLPPRTPSRKARLLRVEGPVLRPGETVMQPLRVRIAPGSPATTGTIQVNGVLIPLVAGVRSPVGNGYTYEVRPEQAPEPP